MRFIWIVYGLLICTGGYSQPELVWQLDSVLVEGVSIRSDREIGNVSRWSKSDLERSSGRSLADLLSGQSTSFIKSYGIGGLATSSIRGGSASQVLVLWNGLPLHSPMLGQLDYSLLPMHFMDEVSLSPGGSTSLWGSGAVSGVVGLETHQPDDLGPLASIQSGLGSFGQLNQRLSLNLGRGKLRSVTRGFYDSARNDFSFDISPKLPSQKLTNAELKQGGFMQSVYYEISPKKSVDFHYWFQNTDREIPPTVTQNESLAKQQDISHRFILAYKQLGRRSASRIKLAYFREQNDYQDPKIALTAENYFSTVLADFSRETQMRNGARWTIGSTQSLTSAYADAYGESRHEYRGALFTTAVFNLLKQELQPSVRMEWVDDRFLPFVPSLSGVFQWNSNWALLYKISRDYRVPTLNDRYWIPGGNSKLLPEQGWSEEIGMRWNSQKGKYLLQLHSSVFNRDIKDWILWSPSESQQLWSASNIAEVSSRGVEFNGFIRRHWSGHIIKIDVGYSYTRSFSRTDVILPRMRKGEQLFYVPRHKGSFGAHWTLKDFNIKYRHMVTSTFRGTGSLIPGYDLGSLEMSYNLDFEKCNWRFFFHLDNLWNTDYVVIENRPMPGRNFRSGIQLNFLQQQK